jgi:hypothetical protein
MEIMNVPGPSVGVFAVNIVCVVVSLDASLTCGCD